MSPAELTSRLFDMIRMVRASLGNDAPMPNDGALRFADLLDSMAMVEFLLVLGEQCGVAPERIETCVQHRFGTVGELATALHQAGITPRSMEPVPRGVALRGTELVPRDEAQAREKHHIALVATAVQLPDAVQLADELNELIGRPVGWLQSHAGIHSRRVWDNQDPVDAAVAAAQTCLNQAALGPADVGTLLVTSEAPPLLTGLAATLHHRLGLPTDVVALEIGGACTGFLSCLWLARQLQAVRPATLVIAVEAPSRCLKLEPGPTGATAALFGDGAAACVLTDRAAARDAMPIADLLLGVDGGGADLIQVRRSEVGALSVHLQGQELSVRALDAMAGAVRALTERNRLQISDLAAVVIHAGNGRFPALLARQLDLPPERVLSQTSHSGNLGSASLPVAWAARPPLIKGPVIWTAVGAGLTWGAALWGA